ncbi:MAG: hypothetical protein J4G00_05990 [Actinomycetia bacterium]|nr:hypothetical protein [Actinomycetes bacterium]
MDKRRNLSPEVRAARAAARAETRAVRVYLEGLQASVGHRGRRKPPQQELAEVQAQLETESDQLRRLSLIQKRIDAQRRLAEYKDPVAIDALEAEFVNVAKSYSARKGISYKAWREMGVAAAVLSKGGIPRTRS